MNRIGANYSCNASRLSGCERQGRVSFIVFSLNEVETFMRGLGDNLMHELTLYSRIYFQGVWRILQTCDVYCDHVLFVIFVGLLPIKMLVSFLKENVPLKF